MFNLEQSQKDRLCRQLIRLTARAFYSFEQWIIVDVLCFEPSFRLKESEIAERLRPRDYEGKIVDTAAGFTSRQIREQAAPLVVDQILQRTLIDFKDARLNDPIVGPTYMPGMIRHAKAEKLDPQYWIDFPHVVNVLRYKFHKMMEVVNARPYDSEEKYECSNPKCPYRLRKYSVHECASIVQEKILSRHGSAREAADAAFRCPHPSCIGPDGKPSLLVVTSDSKTFSGSRESVLARLNQQIQPVVAALNLAAAALEDEQRERQLALARGEAPAPSNTLAAGLSGGDLKHKASAGSSASAAATPAAPTGSSSVFETKFQVQLMSGTSSATSAHTPAASQPSGSAVKTDAAGVNAAGTTAAKVQPKLEMAGTRVAEPLPWLKGRDNQLARQQQLEQQLARQRALEAEKQLKLKEEQAVIKQREEEEFRRQQAVRAEQERIKQDQLQQQQQMALSSSIAGADVPPADASSILTAAAAAPMETTEPDVSFLVAGQSVRLSDLTDEMFERMTPDEYEVYSSWASEHAVGQFE